MNTETNTIIETTAEKFGVNAQTLQYELTKFVEYTQELFNTSWGWLGADLDD